MTFSSNFLKRWSFQKGLRRDMIFLVLSRKMVYFSRKHDIFSLGRKWEITFLKKYIEIWYLGVTPLCQKNQRWSYPAKMHLKVIDVLGWHPRKSSSNSLYSHGDLYRHFHVLLSSEKKTWNSIYRIEVWLLLQFIQLEKFYNEQSSILSTIHLPQAVFGGVLERQ